MPKKEKWLDLPEYKGWERREMKRSEMAKDIFYRNLAWIVSTCIMLVAMAVTVKLSVAQNSKSIIINTSCIKENTKSIFKNTNSIVGLNKDIGSIDNKIETLGHNIETRFTDLKDFIKKNGIK